MEQKKVIKFGPPLTKLSGSAHAMYNLIYILSTFIGIKMMIKCLVVLRPMINALCKDVARSTV